jgi:hypothetical protein
LSNQPVEDVIACWAMRAVRIGFAGKHQSRRRRGRSVQQYQEIIGSRDHVHCKVGKLYTPQFPVLDGRVMHERYIREQGAHEQTPHGERGQAQLTSGFFHL